MPIPNEPLFKAFLEATKLVENKPIDNFIEFSNDEATNKKLLYLCYPNIELKLSSVLKKISVELKNHGCAANDDIALALLGIIAETREPDVPMIEHANKFLSLVHNAQLLQFVILPHKPELGYYLDLGEIVIKIFEPVKIIYWTKKGGCKYPVDLLQLKGRCSIERIPIDTVLIDLDFHHKTLIKKWGSKIAMESIIDNYYQAIDKYYFRMIPSIVSENLLLLEGSALFHIDTNNLLNSFLSQRFGLLHWNSANDYRSWALLNENSFVKLNFVPTEFYNRCNNWLKDEFGLRNGFFDQPLSDTIKSYCRFLQRAQKQRIEGFSDESFLHFVIALDLLLGEDGKSTESVSLRAGVLIHRQLDFSFEAAVNLLKSLYSKRSLYVHAGKRPSDKDLIDVEQISVEVLWAILTTSKLGKFKDINSWLNQLDYIASALKASKVLPESEFQLAGILPIERKRNRPNRVE